MSDSPFSSFFMAENFKKTPPPEISNQDHEQTSEQYLEMVKVLKARLQYAQMKLQTGLSTEDLQQIETAFINSPRQPRRPLPSEYPPTPSSSTPHSKRVKRLLLSAMTPTQNSWRKKKRIREQKRNEAIQDEDAARTILMLKQHQPHTPPSSEHKQGDHYYEDSTSDTDQEDMFEYVASIPNYKENSKVAGQHLPRTTSTPPPPAIVSGSGHNSYQYNRPLPPPPPMYGRPLSEDPFQSKPIVRDNVSLSRQSSKHSSRHSSSPISPLSPQSQSPTN